MAKAMDEQRGRVEQQPNSQYQHHSAPPGTHGSITA